MSGAAGALDIPVMLAAAVALLPLAFPGFAVARGEGALFVRCPLEDASMAQRKLVLAGEKFRNLALDGLLIEKLTACDAVHLRAQRGDAVLVGLLHARLSRRGGADQIVAQDQVRGCKQVADRNGRQSRADQRRHPRTNGKVTDFIAARDDDRMGLLAVAENRCLPKVFHGLPPNP